MGDDKDRLADETASGTAAPAEAGGADTPKQRRFEWTRLWPLAVLVLALGALYLAGAGDYLSLSTISREHEALVAAVADNLAAAIALYVAVYVVAVAVSFPGASLITIVGGLMFGVALGAALTVVAATIGATVLFLAAKTSVGGFLRQRVSGFAGRLAAGFEENAFSYLFALRLVPVFPFWLINVAPALFNVSVRAFVLATALGIIPGTLAFSLLGNGLGATIAELEAQNPGCAAAGTCKIGLGVLLSPGPLIAMGGLCLVALIPIFVKRLRARRNAAHRSEAT